MSFLVYIQHYAYISACCNWLWAQKPRLSPCQRKDFVFITMPRPTLGLTQPLSKAYRGKVDHSLPRSAQFNEAELNTEFCCVSTFLHLNYEIYLSHYLTNISLCNELTICILSVTTI